MVDASVVPLTAQQRAAVDAEAHALEIRAGAGTGKTHTLACRVARFAQADAHDQHRLRVVTFTREATAVLQRRLALLLGRDHLVQVGSFHQWAARELPREERQFLADGDQRRILQRALRRTGASGGFTRAMGSADADDLPTRVAGFLSYVRNAETSVGGAVNGVFSQLAPWENVLVELQDAYEDGKQGRLDYDDLLVRFRDRLKSSSALRKQAAARLDHLFVDEYQDVNAIQAETVRLLTSKPEGSKVTIVGDPRQSIYAFRGGSPEHMERFLDAYGRRGKRVLLSTNFRSSSALVDAGNRLLPSDNPLRARRGAPGGTSPQMLSCETPEDEACAVADHVERLLAQGVDPKEIAVLTRSRPLAQAYVEETLDRRNAETWAQQHPALMDAAIDHLVERKPVPRELTRAAAVLMRRMRVGPPAPKRLTARHLLDLPRAEGLESVTLATVHAAKGLEWDHVVLLGAREGGLPSEQALRTPADHLKDALAEERRLAYVAMTRARRSLLVTWPERDGRRERGMSRFLEPLQAAPEAVLRS